MSRLLVSLAKKVSTALRQDAEVGVKRKVQRGCRASHSRTLGCFWVALFLTTAWIAFRFGTRASVALRSFVFLIEFFLH